MNKKGQNLCLQCYFLSVTQRTACHACVPINWVFNSLFHLHFKSVMSQAAFYETSAHKTQLLCCLSPALLFTTGKEDGHISMTVMNSRHHQSLLFLIPTHFFSNIGKYKCECLLGFILVLESSLSEVKCLDNTLFRFCKMASSNWISETINPWVPGHYCDTATVVWFILECAPNFLTPLPFSAP